MEAGKGLPGILGVEVLTVQYCGMLSTSGRGGCEDGSSVPHSGLEMNW